MCTIMKYFALGTCALSNYTWSREENKALGSFVNPLGIKGHNQCPKPHNMLSIGNHEPLSEIWVLL
jgi:hypothetical protein